MNYFSQIVKKGVGTEGNKSPLQQPILSSLQIPESRHGAAWFGLPDHGDARQEVVDILAPS